MDFLVEPSAVFGGEVGVPGDKSISHRALMLGAIAEGQSTITGFLAGEDCLASLSALRSMGVGVEQVDATTVRISGVGMRGLRAAGHDIDLGNSGTAMRLFAGLLSPQVFSSRLVGDASLSSRPMHRVIKPLTLMGAEIDSRDGRPPLSLSGGRELTGISYSLPIASAQVKSAILLAGLYASGETTVMEPSTTRDHTERMLASMGARLHCSNGRITIVGGQTLHAVDTEVPADLSSATFLMLATLMSKDGDVVIRNVGVNSTRIGVIRIFRDMGAFITFENGRMCGAEPVADIRVQASRLRGIDVDPSLVSLAIDEFPALFVAAAAADGVTRFRGIGELRLKESDRIGAMVRGLDALGIAASETEDGATVTGGPMMSGEVRSEGDHRIAMSFAVAGSIAEGPVRILDAETVNTSFPRFVESMTAIGVNIISEISSDG